MNEIDENDKKAIEWLKQNHPEIIEKWNSMTHGEQFRATRMVPCRIRCGRCGYAIPSNPCSECGKPND